MAHHVTSLADSDTGRTLRNVDGWTAEIVQPGTSTLITIYSNKQLTTVKANPILLDKDGTVDFYLQSFLQFDLVTKKGGVEIDRVSNLEMVGSDG